MGKPGHWLTDHLSPYEKHQHKAKKTIVRKKTRFQEATIADSYEFGRCLVLDGEIQSAERDEFIYHESLVHPAMTMHSGPRDVLILGGGEGATVREVLRHRSVRRVTMVDIDGEVVEFCHQYLQKWHQGSFSDRRTTLLIQDAAKFIRETGEQFDIIICDLPTPTKSGGPLMELYSTAFFRRLEARLRPKGIFVTQAGSGSFFQLQWNAKLYKQLKSIFKVVRSFYSFVPSFDVPWGFLIASRAADPRKASAAQIDRRLGTIRHHLRFYDGETHEGLFRIPKYMRMMVK
jgi:spermidine synthase